MKLRIKTVGVLAGVMAAALAGLIFLQYYLLRNAIELKEQAFRQNVNAAMNAVTQKLQTRETVNNVFQYVTAASGMHQITVKVDSDSLVHESFSRDPFAGSMATIQEELTGSTGMMKIFSPPLRIDGNVLHYSVTKPQHVILRVFNTVGRQDTVLVDTVKEPGQYAVEFDRSRFPDGQFYCKFGAGSSAFVMKVAYGETSGMLTNVESSEQRRAFVGKVLDNLVVNERQPVERRIDPAILDTLIKTSLQESGITLPFAYGVLNEQTNSLRIVQPAVSVQAVRDAEFRMPLFPFDFLSSRNELLLYFPDQRLFLLKQIGPLLALTILLMSVIIFCFAATLRMIVRQKQFSGRLVDFINNMTHEFKTPISTIAVASETLIRPEVLEQKDRVLRYGNVIHDENLRMKNHVDRILQMAVLEEGNYELKLSTIDVHDVIQKVAANMLLRIESRGGTLECSLDAAEHLVDADIVHLTNIFHNLLDNADKYSPETPNIRITTRNSDASIIIRIADNGIGIGKDEMKKVFEKYYRVPTGNIHNVKGFGLGLSYVKLIADAHGADANIESEPGKGTAVTLVFPLTSHQGSVQ